MTVQQVSLHNTKTIKQNKAKNTKTKAPININTQSKQKHHSSTHDLAQVGKKKMETFINN